jgi:phosphoribosyl-ATP pyrophosphohydrolase/phosphoribosyl-AMP cyclohydrolase
MSAGPPPRPDPAAAAARPALDPDALHFDDCGLLPVVAQDAATGAVLMLAWADREAVERTLATGEAWFWSRSRRALWRKGETSGNTLAVAGVAVDCDGDALLYRVHPSGPACHTGATSCFEGEGGGLDHGALGRIVASRAGADPARSYTARLLESGVESVAQKGGEEATEVVVASLRAEDGSGRARLVEETADLLFHLAVLLRSRGVDVVEVARELAARHRETDGGGASR